MHPMWCRISSINSIILVSLYSLTTKSRFSKVQSLNGWLKPVGIGAFHCAVQASHKFMGVENEGLGGTKVKKML